MNSHLEGAEPAVFEDPRNITVGAGRVIYALATTDHAGRYHPEGWVLPGGARTSSKARATRVATNINRSRI